MSWNVTINESKVCIVVIVGKKGFISDEHVQKFREMAPWFRWQERDCSDDPICEVIS